MAQNADKIQKRLDRIHKEPYADNTNSTAESADRTKFESKVTKSKRPSPR